jgi:uncharacterized membrane protein YedE/YeeE
VAGPLIGLLVVGLLWALNKPFGALGGYVDAVEWAQARAAAPSWRAFFLPGIVLGGLLSALASGFQPTFAYGSFDATLGGSPALKGTVLLLAGGLIGYGARLAGGCTSGHGMCGTAMGSPASLVATMTFMGAAIVTANLIALAIRA